MRKLMMFILAAFVLPFGSSKHPRTVGVVVLGRQTVGQATTR